MKYGRELDELVDVQQELMTALSRSGGLDETLEHCYRAAVRLSGMDSGGIYLASPDGSLRLHFHRDLGEEFVKVNGVVSADDPRAGLVRAGHSLYSSMSQLRAATGRHDDADPEVGEGLKALAVVPILFDGEPVGCMNLASHSLEHVPDASREVLELLAGQIAQSISREMANATMREREENLNTFFDSVDDFLFVLNESGGIATLNRSLSRALGRPESALLGTHVLEIHPPNVREAARAVLDDILSGRTLSHELPLQGPDGPIPTETRITRGTWNGQVAFFCVARDVTEKRRFERELQQAQKLESLGLLAGGIAHDFNNILVSVLGTASVALAEIDDASPTRPHLDDIIAGSRRAAALCRQMLAYSGRGRFIVEPLDLSEQVAELAGLMRTSTDRISLALDEDLPRFEGDASQISQVIMNLVINAVEAIDEHTGSVQIRTGKMPLNDAALARMVCSQATPGEFVFVEVRDNGSGMTLETVERLFDPFFTTKVTGRGLGMSAVIGIVRSHSGALSLETSPGRGSTFRVYIPASNAKAPRAPIATGSELRPADILLVDDDPTVLKVIGRILEGAGMRVDAVTSGEEAVAQFSTNPRKYDLVLLDLTMPRIDGASTFQRLSEVEPSVPVVIMSGYTEEEFSLRIGDQAPSGFLGKPFSREELLDAVRVHANCEQPIS